MIQNPPIDGLVCAAACKQDLIDKGMCACHNKSQSIKSTNILNRDTAEWIIEKYGIEKGLEHVTFLAEYYEKIGENVPVNSSLKYEAEFWRKAELAFKKGISLKAKIKFI